MARSIGEFGAAVAEVEEPDERLTFTIGSDKSEFYVTNDLGFIPFGQFAQAATNGLDTADMEGAAAVMDMMHDMIDDNPGDGKKDSERTAEQEWARFKQVCRTHKITMDVLLEVIGAVFTAESGRPTEQPSDSSDGQSKTETGPSSRPKPRSVKRLKGAEFEPVTGDVLKELVG